MANNFTLDSNESKKIINKCDKEVRRIQAIYQDTECIKTINDFINTFKKCEIVCKIVLKEYLEKIKKYTSDDKIVLRVPQIKAALNMINLKIDDKIIQKIFSSDDTKNRRSARKIRNYITHKMPQTCIDELKRRNEDLINTMNLFINSFENNKYIQF